MSDEDRDEARSMAHDDLIDAMLDGAEYCGPEAYTLTAELRLAEERGYRRAIQALRDRDDEDAAAFERAKTRYWDGWPFAHDFRRAADYLESLAAALRKDDANA